MGQREELGADGREQGSLLLSQTLRQLQDHPRRREWVDHLQQDLRRAIAARGSLAAALQRPSQLTGMSNVNSRLRDLDLRIALADSLGADDARAEQARWLDEAVQIADTLPGLSADRVRNLCSQQAELALAEQRPGDAVAVVERFLAKVGDQGGGNYLAAVLLMRARADIDAPGEPQRLADEVVRRLRLAVEQKEVKRSAVQHEQFAELRTRADFQALLEQ
jgi:hypothetical protein